MLEEMVMPHQLAKSGLTTSTSTLKNADVSLRYHTNTSSNRLQYQTEGAVASKYKLNFNHPVKELIWTNTTGAITTQKAKITLNGHDRFAQQDREYFQLRQPLDHHTAVPLYNVKETERAQSSD